MKRFLSLSLACALALSLLSACGGKTSGAGSSAPSGSASQSAPAANVDLAAFLASLQTKFGDDFRANQDLAEYPDMLDGFYPGLTDVSTRQLLVYQPMMTAVVCEIALAEAEDAAGADALKNIFQARIDAQVDGGAWYPESIEGWQNNSRVVVKGNYVLMIAWEKCDEVVSQFNALF